MDREYTRREFYDLVWSQPMRTLAGGFGISDVALAKHCKKANIPVPERGYWARTQAGKRVSQIALPPRFFGASDRIGWSSHHHAYGSDWAEQYVKMSVPEVPEFEEVIESVRQRAIKVVGNVRNQKTFEPAHPLVARLLAHDEERRQDSMRWQSSYFSPKYESGTERRRLLIINTLFLASARIGCRPSMSTSKYQDARDGRQLEILIGDQPIYFAIEAIASRKGQQREGLRLSLGSVHSRTPQPQYWEDNEEASLEHQLTTVLVEMLVASETAYRRSLIERREWIIERKAAAEKELRERKEKAEREAKVLAEKKERERIGRLLAQARALNRANQIRAYVSTALSRATEMPLDISEINEWAAWARRQADQLDPVANGTILNAIRTDCASDE